MSLSDFMNELEEMAEEDSDNSQRISGEDGYSYSGIVVVTSPLTPKSRVKRRYLGFCRTMKH